MLPFNDAAACERIIAAQAAELAAVFVDPLVTGAGFVLPADGFLTHLRDMAPRCGVLPVFDEIISFRARPGGTQERYGVRPDPTALAEVVAGGTPGGAFGGRADLTTLLDPTRGAKIPRPGPSTPKPSR